MRDSERDRGLHRGGQSLAPRAARLNRRLTLGPCLLVMLAAWPAAAQTGTGSVLVRVRSGAAPVSSADVTAGGLTVQTDVQGEARMTLPEGEQPVSVVRVEIGRAHV